MKRKCKTNPVVCQTPKIDTSKYKEPFKTIPGGFGYYGILSESEDGDSVQCHVCGRWCRQLPAHLRSHDLTAADYKEKYHLSRGTALVSRQRRVEMAKQYNETARKHLPSWRKGGKQSPHKVPLSLESKNKRGTCRDQLIDKIRAVAEHYHTENPTWKMFKLYYRYKYQAPLLAEFGGWVEATKAAGYKPLSELTKERIAPENLLEALRRFYQQEGRLSQYHDHKARTELPDYKTYAKYFGSIKNARKMAGLPELVWRKL